VSNFQTLKELYKTKLFLIKTSKKENKTNRKNFQKA
jgi:hypothetical protein